MTIKQADKICRLFFHELSTPAQQLVINRIYDPDATFFILDKANTKRPRFLTPVDTTILEAWRTLRNEYAKE